MGAAVWIATTILWLPLCGLISGYTGGRRETQEEYDREAQRLERMDKEVIEQGYRKVVHGFRLFYEKDGKIYWSGLVV